MTNTDNHRTDRHTAGGLLGGAAVCVVLAASTGSEAPVWLAAGMLGSSLVLYMRTAEKRPYAYWLGWATGAVLALLLAWVLEDQRFLLLPWAGVEALVAAVLALLWHLHRDGRRDWIVCDEDLRVLRREPSLKAAEDWVRRWWRKTPVVCARVDRHPGLDIRAPLYPDREFPGRRRDEEPG
ncbi:hypothetical protein [Streptomyces nigrescens]|uniref:hypothetical protein n=1 Tax=Streptomyces nigrescens TaxID=1920 RepID=UPI0036FE5500